MNKIILIGNLTRDPELKSTPSGESVCEFTIAVNDRSSRSQQDGQDNAQYFRVSAWRQLGENCQRYLSKGRKVFVAGPLKARTYQANDGTTRVSLEVTASDVEFLSSRNDDHGNAGYAPVSAPAAPAPDAGIPAGATVVNDDECPF